MLVFLLSLVIFMPDVYAHNWITSPTTRDGNVAYPGPNNCDPVSGGGNPTFTTYQTDQSVPITWTTEHTGSHYFAVAPYDGPADNDVNVANTSPFFTESTYPPPTATMTMSFGNLGLSPGNYTVQYRWSTYRSCFDITLLGVPPSDAQLISGNLYSIPYGTYNAATGVSSCNTGYIPNSSGSCVITFGRWVGICFLVALLCVFFGGIAWVIYLKLKHPEKLQQYLDRIRHRGGGGGGGGSGDSPAPGTDMP